MSARAKRLHLQSYAKMCLSKHILSRKTPEYYFLAFCQGGKRKQKKKLAIDTPFYDCLTNVHEPFACYVDA